MSLAERHLSPEALSAYLDDEVQPGERPNIERHLDECVSCRRHLDGLRRVTAGLHRLERAAPPPVLDAAVRHLVLNARPRGITARWEARSRLLGGLLSSQVLIMFALVFSLALILFLFADGLERRARTDPILVPVLEVEGEIVVDRRQVGDQSFELREGRWWPVGVVGTPIRSLATTSPAVRDLMVEQPALIELLETGAPVVLELEGDLVEIEPAGEGDAEAPAS